MLFPGQMAVDLNSEVFGRDVGMVKNDIIIRLSLMTSKLSPSIKIIV